MANSPAPGTPQTGYKAYVAAGFMAVGTFVTAWVADTAPFTGKEAAAAAVAAVIASGITGVTTFRVRNKAK